MSSSRDDWDGQPTRVLVDPGDKVCCIGNEKVHISDDYPKPVPEADEDADPCPSPDGRRRQKKCFNCNKKGHTSRNCTTPANTCFNCGIQGHFTRNCPSPKVDVKGSCYHCHQPGHLARDCALLKPTKKALF